MWVNRYGLIDPAIGYSGTKRSDYGAKVSAAHMDTYPVHQERLHAALASQGVR